MPFMDSWVYFASANVPEWGWLATTNPDVLVL